MIILYNKQKNYYTNNDTNAKYLTQHPYKIRTISSWNISITIQRYFLARQHNFSAVANSHGVGEEYGWSETPRIHGIYAQRVGPVA